jgi:hypothetical protein
VPQGVLCEHVFHNNSWSWGVITHHCHRLHNVPVQFFSPEQKTPRDASYPRPPRLHAARQAGGRRRCLPPPPAGRTAGID